MQTRREKSRLGQPLSACSGTGVFVGYASLFGVRDASGDMVMPGGICHLAQEAPAHGGAHVVSA